MEQESSNVVQGRVTLPILMQANPGVFAVLLGAGMSRAAGLPTAWEVKQDLMRKVAKAEGVPEDQLGTVPETWWEATGRGELRYDTLLGALAPHDTTRQALVRPYFEGDAEGGAQPGAAHRALARLCRDGRVRVILTTNLDRLMERALDQAGVRFQVVSSASEVASMTVLRHAGVSVVKLHGDYGMLGQRHSPVELRSYPPPLKKLLKAVFDEYGLLVVGWSASFDVALIQAFLGAPGTRYPTYWVAHDGHVTDEAKKCIAHRTAVKIVSTGADEFFEDLTQRLARLEEVAQARTAPRSVAVRHLSPREDTALAGWEAIPLLHVRVASAIGPAELNACGKLRYRERQKLLQALIQHQLTAVVGALNSNPARTFLDEPGIQDSGHLFGTWAMTPGADQTGTDCSYRIESDGNSGVSAILRVRLPGPVAMERSVDHGLVTLDVGMSVINALRLYDLGTLFIEGLLFTTGVVPPIIAGILPPDAEVRSIELHAMASRSDGHNQQRENDIARRIEIGRLGKTTRDHIGSWSYGAVIRGPLDRPAANNVVVQAIEEMALDTGFVPEPWNMNAIRGEFGLPPLPG